MPSICDCGAPLLDIPGVFVFGSNDYYAPKIGNPFTTWVGPTNYTAANRITVAGIELGAVIRWLDRPVESARPHQG